MCTVTIISLDDDGGRRGFRLVTNRDEQRARPAASRPSWQELGPSLRAIFPVDAEGGGTWIAATSGGLVLCLLNANPLPPPELPARNALSSRGVIIPGLIRSGGCREAMASLASLELRRFAPFRLVAVEGASGGAGTAGGAAADFAAIEASWDRRSLSVRDLGPGPVCLVSSGLGDPLVAPRLALFDESVRNGGPVSREKQDWFHRHVWPDRPEISVLMSRPDARTVSITSVEVVTSQPRLDRAASLPPPRVVMAYEAMPDCNPAPPTILRTQGRRSAMTST